RQLLTKECWTWRNSIPFTTVEHRQFWRCDKKKAEDERKFLTPTKKRSSGCRQVASGMGLAQMLGYGLGAGTDMKLLVDVADVRVHCGVTYLHLVRNFFVEK